MAERQGILTGPFLSEVQSYAVAILMDLEDVAAYRHENDSFMRALLARSDMDPRKMFPDHFEGGGTTTEEVDGDDVEYDYTAVEWKGPSDVDEAELKEILGMLSEAQGKVDMEQTQNMLARDWT